MNALAPLARRLVFRAHDTHIDVPPTNYELDREGVVLRGWVTRPRSERAVIYFGGNAEDLSGWRLRFRTSLGGRASYLVAYRGYGSSDGEPTERDLVEDGVALFLDVASRHTSVAVIGRSLGSGVASQVTSDPRVRDRVEAVVLVTPFDSLAGVVRPLFRGLPFDWLLPDRFRSDRHVGSIPAPVLVLRAGRDTIVRPAATDRLVAALPPGARVIDFPDADHQTIAGLNAYWHAIQRFLGEPVLFETGADRDAADPWVLEGE
ncbi:alpha-beta hydrolase superfamily lysophospholipase [Nocardioides sp. BE266]|uniref:alpha/beta hydrolase n=1 Tax=Nocardioides sp. BE266 TaxID=2817725 RepID=UPI00285F9299|nr:hypothetical protein [Nocardioides sp. BE266]MDR7253637.1 alpha-beta hydrolase superfamily lysophospholipase [Nocardioides sp. BE266]